MIHNKAFDGLTGKFPIGFLIWETNQNADKKIPITEILVEVLDKNAKPIGNKLFYNLPNSSFLNVWLCRPEANKEVVLPIKNAISPATAIPKAKFWSNNAIAYMHCGGNDPQQTEQLTTIYSSIFSNGHGFYITPENVWQAAIIFSVRRLIRPTWLNDRDQFLQPTEALSEEFKTDCLIWMLFNRCNRTASANNLEWNKKNWSIVNHFIPFTESEVNSPERFESNFMQQYLADKILSKEAAEVLNAGRQLWQAYFSQIDTHNIRDEFKLNRPDVGWYQVRKALAARNSSGDFTTISFDNFESSYKILTEKLQPKVFELGFLKS